MPRGNFTSNRGPKTLAGRIKQLQGLRNVGSKIATDRDYLNQVYDDGMEFVSERKKREAARVHNEFTRVVKNNIIKPKGENKNYEAPKEWIEDFEAKRQEHQLSLEEARLINDSKIKAKGKDPFSYSKSLKTRNYGNGPQTWLPSVPKSASVFYDDDDDWYSSYKKLQSPKSYY